MAFDPLFCIAIAVFILAAFLVVFLIVQELFLWFLPSYIDQFEEFFRGQTENQLRLLDPPLRQEINERIRMLELILRETL